MRILHVGFGFRPWIVNGLIIYCEDMMSGQAQRGHDVAYFFAGRQLPLLRRPLLHRWRRSRVTMFEWLNSSLVVGRHNGSPEPLHDLSDPATERAFAATLERFRPQLVHFQDLGGLPSSLPALARARGLGTVLTMHDYFSLCPTVKLYDAHGQICDRRRPGEMCVVCCANAPHDNAEELRRTLWYERTRLRETLPGLDPALRHPAVDAVGAAAIHLTNRISGVTGVAVRTPATAEAAPEPDTTPRRGAGPAEYQRRRDVNLDRLDEVDAIVTYAERSNQICRHLGLDGANLRTLRMNPRHIERLRPKRDLTPGDPLRFAVLNAANSTQKGADLLLESLRELTRRGLDGRFVLSIHGWVAPHIHADLAAHPAIRVEGAYGAEQLDEMLEYVDVGLVPSVWEEVFGFVGLEFLAKGIPVIGNARGAIPEYVLERETGWLNHSASASELADLMEGAIREPGAVRRLSESVRGRLDRLIQPFAVQVSELIGLYDDVLAMHP